MFLEIIILIFFLVASVYLASKFYMCGEQMKTLESSNESLSEELVETRACLDNTKKENVKLAIELGKTRADLALTRGELEKTRSALNSCTDAIHGIP